MVPHATAGTEEWSPVIAGLNVVGAGWTLVRRAVNSRVQSWTRMSSQLKPDI